MKFRASAVMICAMLLGGSALPVFAGNVRTDYNHQANFAQYHTYTWGNVKTSDPFYTDRIKQAVDKQLQAKGWQLATSGASVTIFASDNLHNQKDPGKCLNREGRWTAKHGTLPACVHQLRRSFCSP